MQVFFEILFSILLDICPEVGLLDHMIVVFFFFFEELPYCLLQQPHQKGMRVPISPVLVNTSYVVFFTDSSHPRYTA